MFIFRRLAWSQMLYMPMEIVVKHGSIDKNVENSSVIAFRMKTQEHLPRDIIMAKSCHTCKWLSQRDHS